MARRILLIITARRRLRRLAAGSVVTLGLMAPMLAPSPASAYVEVFADASNAGDAVSFKGWAVNANPSQVFSWRIRLWDETCGDFGRCLIQEHIKQNFGGSTSFSTPTYYDFGVYHGHLYCTYFNVYRKSSASGTPDIKKSDCVTH